MIAASATCLASYVFPACAARFDRSGPGAAGSAPRRRLHRCRGSWRPAIDPRRGRACRSRRHLPQQLVAADWTAAPPVLSAPRGGSSVSSGWSRRRDSAARSVRVCSRTAPSCGGRVRTCARDSRPGAPIWRTGGVPSPGRTRLAVDGAASTAASRSDAAYPSNPPVTRTSRSYPTTVDAMRSIRRGNHRVR